MRALPTFSTTPDQQGHRHSQGLDVEGTGHRAKIWAHGVPRQLVDTLQWLPHEWLRTHLGTLGSLRVRSSLIAR